MQPKDTTDLCTKTPVLEKGTVIREPIIENAHKYEALGYYRKASAKCYLDLYSELTK